MTAGFSITCATAPLRHAHDRLRDTGDPDAASDLLCTTTDGARVLAARMRPLPTDGGRAGLCPDPARRDGRPCRRRRGARRFCPRRLRQDAPLRPPTFRPSSACRPDDGTAPPRLMTHWRTEVAPLPVPSPTLAAATTPTGRTARPMPHTRASDLLDGLKARLGGPRGIDGHRQPPPAAALQRVRGDRPLSPNSRSEVAGTDGARDHAGLDRGRRHRRAAPPVLARGRRWRSASMDRWLAAASGPDTADATGRDVLAAACDRGLARTACPTARAALCLPIR